MSAPTLSWTDRKTAIAAAVNTLPMVFGIASGVELGLSRWWPFLGFAILAIGFEYVASLLWMLAYRSMSRDALGKGIGS